MAHVSTPSPKAQPERSQRQRGHELMATLRLTHPHRAQPLQRRVSWSDILRPLRATDVRERFLSAYRAAGYSPASFFKPAAKAAARDALAAAETWLAAERRTVEQGALAAVRRALESETG